MPSLATQEEKPLLSHLGGGPWVVRAWLQHNSPKLLPRDMGTYKAFYTQRLTRAPLAPHEGGMVSPSPTLRLRY